MSRDDEAFLSRWSRRKRGADAVEPDAGAPPDPAPPPPDPDEDDAAVLARLDLPDPDTLGPGSDFSGFMSRGVPEQLRRRALRRLWRSNPTLAVLDGLNDYDDDFSGGFVKPGGLRTAYEVGRGLLARDAEPEKAATSHVQDGPQSDAAGISASAGANTDADPDATLPDDLPDDPAVPAEEEAPVQTATRRRMVFRTPGNG